MPTLLAAGDGCPPVQNMAGVLWSGCRGVWSPRWRCRLVPHAGAGLGLYVPAPVHEMMRPRQHPPACCGHAFPLKVRRCAICRRLRLVVPGHGRKAGRASKVNLRRPRQSPHSAPARPPVALPQFQASLQRPPSSPKLNHQHQDDFHRERHAPQLPLLQRGNRSLGHLWALQRAAGCSAGEWQGSMATVVVGPPWQRQLTSANPHAVP